MNLHFSLEAMSPPLDMIMQIPEYKISSGVLPGVPITVLQIIAHHILIKMVKGFPPIFYFKSLFQIGDSTLQRL